MSFKRYPAYKDSGVEWLGEVPEHWEVVPLKQVVSRIESGTSVNSTDTPAGTEELGVLKTSCVYRGFFEAEENKAVVPEEYDRVACPVTAGTLIVSRMNTPELVGAAGVVRTSYNNLFLPDRLWQVHFSGALPDFVHHWTHTPNYRSQVEMACAGTSSSMQNLGQDEFRRFVITLPPVPEQTAIATFLDHETAKIDALVAEQEKLINLLQEKRQAVISHAVTKGLNPNITMKDSGVEWLGEVPAHWEVMPLKRDIEFVTSGARGWAENYADDGDLFLRIGNLTRDGIRLDLSDSQRVVVPESAEVARTQVKAGDILFSITAYLGSVAVIPQGLGRAFVSQHVALVRPSKKRCLSEWLAYLAISYVGKTHLETTGYGGTKVQLSLADVTSLPILIPSIDEQAGLIEFLNGETAKLDTLMAEARTAITLLQERRTALISAAVTGQIDVRDWTLQVAP